LILIAISLAAYEAIKSTLPPGADLRPRQRDAKGDYLIQVEARWLDALAALGALARATATLS